MAGANAVAGKFVDVLFGVAKREICYMWYYKANVQALKRALRDLKDMRERVQQQIGVAASKGDNLKHGVEKWVRDADEEIFKAEEFLEQEASADKTCFKIGMCGNWGALHHYGKKMVTTMSPSLLRHKASGVSYEGGVSVYTPAPTQLDVYENKNLEDLVTHNEALDDIVAALKDESKQIIGIYGLGGVGKTTLAKEVVARVKNNLMFADVAFTTVSQTVKVNEIKKDIGEATKRIMKGDKILIILDDVWEKLSLEDLSIPCGSNYMNCKILLTSRSEKVCQKMNVQSKILVNSLPTEEAWILFKRVVGERMETDANLKSVALKVVEECGGLPLLIQAVGNALKDESIHSWNLALSRLKKVAPSEIDPDIRKAFTHLKLSYDYLESEEAKSCFLLCSMFPEDSAIKLEKLVLYGMGLGKFDDLDGIEDARSRVEYAVNILTSSCLLLNVEDDKGYIKMHDVVRDVALLIASEGNNKFLVKAGKGLTEWLPLKNDIESYTGISLMRNQICKLPDYEVCLPRLDIFITNGNYELSLISDEFIRGIKEVKVLDMGWSGNPRLPQSLKQLTKLRMLNLERNGSFQEISLLGEMTELEVLILNKTKITEIPQEIGELVNLRVLEVNNCENLSRITPGVISELSRLEELCIGLLGVQEGVYDCIVEVMTLSKLTYLDLTVPNFDDIPDQGFNLSKLKGFVIQIGEYGRRFICSRSRRQLILSTKHLRIPLVNWLRKTIEVTHGTTLQSIENLNNIMPHLYHVGFHKLEHIRLNDCDNVSCLVDSTSCDWDQGKTEEKLFMELKHLTLSALPDLEIIWKCPDEYISLANLVYFHIFECDKLARVFTVSVAQGLVHLKHLRIERCGHLEEVIWGGDAEKVIMVFPSLVNIFFDLLRSLKSFYSGNGNCVIKYPSLVDVTIYKCRSMKTWGPGIHETPNLKRLEANDDVIDGPCAINEAVAKSYEALEKEHEEFDKERDNNNDDEAE